jgi:hypothetical protein
MRENTKQRDRGYYASYFTTNELRRMLREAEDRGTRADRDMYVIQEISAALTRREWDEFIHTTSCAYRVLHRRALQRATVLAAISTATRLAESTTSAN